MASIQKEHYFTQGRQSKYGCFPPFVWSTWKRTSDYTNNNQEGYNSNMNKELKQQHPSPGILLCFLRKQIILAEYNTAESKLGDPGPRRLKTHKTMATKRTNIKLIMKMPEV